MEVGLFKLSDDLNSVLIKAFGYSGAADDEVPMSADELSFHMLKRTPSRTDIMESKPSKSSKLYKNSNPSLDTPIKRRIEKGKTKGSDSEEPEMDPSDVSEENEFSVSEENLWGEVKNNPKSRWADSFLCIPVPFYTVDVSKRPRQQMQVI
eukprot:GHVP01019184.1.p1 GENE.GHVP01019184.1~~GHVP01019184.1.p1  ORF type:complete len:159 (+),score=38.23 GHVP01019184.1:25-477(+)